METSMSVSSISGATPPNPPSAQDSSFRTAMQQLTSAISSGDMKGAQTAYATLTNLQQNSGQSNSTGPLAQFLSTIGADLSKGDLTTAQSDLTSFQAAHGKHHHHAPPAANGASSDNAPSSPTATASSSGGTPTTSSSNVVDISA
jgi:hypothetical protein